MASAFDRALRRADSLVFIYLFLPWPARPPFPGRAAALLCKRGRSRGDAPRGRGPGSAKGAARGGWGCACGPRPSAVTTRRAVVAGSLAPWAEAASPRAAPGGCKQGRAARYLTRAGPGRVAAAALRCPRARGRTRRAVGVGKGVTAEARGAHGWPTPALLRLPARAHGWPPALRLAACPDPSHKRLIFVGVAASLWLPRDWYPGLCKLALFPAALLEAAELRRS